MEIRLKVKRTCDCFCREILLSSLVTCSRQDIVPTIVKLLSSRVISDTRGSVMMTMVSLYTTSTPNLARDLLVYSAIYFVQLKMRI